MYVSTRLNSSGDCDVVGWYIHYADRGVETVEDRRNLLDPISFEFNNNSTSTLGRRMVIGRDITSVAGVSNPASRISKERGVIILDGGVCSTHPPGRLRNSLLYAVESASICVSGECVGSA